MESNKPTRGNRKRQRNSNYECCHGLSSARSIIVLVLCGSLFSQNCVTLQALPWSTPMDGTAKSRSRKNLSFLSRLSMKATVEWEARVNENNSTDEILPVVADEPEAKQDLGEEDRPAFFSKNIGARLLGATRNSTLGNTLTDPMDSLSSLKGFFQRNFFEDNGEGKPGDTLGDSDDELDSGSSIYARFRGLTKDSFVNALAEKIPSMRIIKGFVQRNGDDAVLGPDEENSQHDENDVGFFNPMKSFGGAWLASTRNHTLANALAEQIRSIPSVKGFLQRHFDNTTGNFDFAGAVSTAYSSSSFCGGTTVPGVGEALAASSTVTRLDRFAQAMCLKLGKIAVVQCVATWLRSRQPNWIQQLADKILSEESASAVKKIRTMLDNMEAHGVVDVFSMFSSHEVAASLYALYRLQRAAIRYEAIEESREPYCRPQDLITVLEDLSHYVVYATAAYGWKMDLAFQGKLHLGDEHALLRKTGIEKQDIIKLSSKSKAHLPVYLLVRDRQRKALVLCIRGTWSANDVLTDLCCTPQEYQGPATSDRLAPSAGTTKAGGHRYCAHHGMLEAAMTVAIDMEDVIEEELKAYPEFSLVLVGHSMGAGCCSLLATFWEKKFANMKAYVFGGPCVAPLDSRPTNNTAIINVITEGDPFRCLSLGHVADITAAVARLCEDPELRRRVMTTTEGHVHEMSEDNLAFCWETMEVLRNEVMTHSDKMFPPGRIFYITSHPNMPGRGLCDSLDYDSDTEDQTILESSATDGVFIHEVGPLKFRELIICPRMFDISRHLPSLYEGTLLSLMESELGRSKQTLTTVN